nr:aminoacyl-tRNA hydrolase [Roseburia sp. AM59-24XD]
MYIIVGLGNPERRYDGTRHNIGFSAVTALADIYGISMDMKKHRAVCGKGVIEGQKVILAMPQTYMNLSGESVRELVDYYKIDPEEELIVIYDDINLAPGKLRIRPKGSAGGHNGIKNIIAHLGTQVFPRIRIASVRSRRAGIWQIMCWDVSPRRKSRLSERLWRKRRRHAVRSLRRMSLLP